MGRQQSGRSGGGEPMVDPIELRLWLERSCEAQGVPVLVTDAVVLSRVGVLLHDFGLQDEYGLAGQLAA
jgi:hypothetical protein